MESLAYCFLPTTAMYLAMTSAISFVTEIKGKHFTVENFQGQMRSTLLCIRETPTYRLVTGVSTHCPLTGTNDASQRSHHDVSH